MDYIIENPDMLEAFKSVAYINVKKLPGLTKSNHYNISIAYNKYKNILLKQIKYYNPDIIIGGSTLHNFFPDLNIKKCELVRFDNFKYAIKFI